MKTTKVFKLYSFFSFTLVQMILLILLFNEAEAPHEESSPETTYNYNTEAVYNLFTSCYTLSYRGNIFLFQRPLQNCVLFWNVLRGLII